MDNFDFGGFPGVDPDNSSGQDQQVTSFDTVEPQSVPTDSGSEPVKQAEPVNESFPWSKEPEPAEEPPSVDTYDHKKQRKSVLPLFAFLLSLGVLALSLITFLVTNARITEIQSLMEEQSQAYSTQIQSLKDQINQAAGSQGAVAAPQPDGSGTVVTPTAGMTPAQIYTKCVNSTVAINCTGYSYSFGQQMPTGSSGSGFILSEDGYVVTNYHVVEGNDEIQITLNDGTSYDAEYIGGNEANDIALIKVEATGLPAVTVGDSTKLVVGDQVVAIGNPLGELASTLTVGYISAKDRIVNSEGVQINMLQTDAAINPGNSGGPLFNMNGEVIGITSAKYSGTTDSGASIEGIGFAIPMDDVMSMLNDLRDFGYITGGYLGVSVSEVDQETANLYGLPNGVLVREVTKGSCAEKAGIQVQDIIVKLGEYEIKNLNELSRALNKYSGGDEVQVTVYRAGGERTLTVVLDERPQQTEAEEQPTEPAQNEQYYSPWPDDFFNDWFGGFFG